MYHYSTNATQFARAFSCYLPPERSLSSRRIQQPEEPTSPIHCWLTNKINNPAAINRASTIPTTNETTGCRLGLASLDLAPFCAAPIPNQNRSLSIDRSAPSQEAGGSNYLWTDDASLWRRHSTSSSAKVTLEAKATKHPPATSNNSKPTKLLRSQITLAIEHIQMTSGSRQ